MTGYDKRFYASAAADLGRTSADAVAEMVYDAVQPTSMVDLGCGNGAWVKAFAELGVDDHLGIDGAWVDRDWLDFPAERFLERDLSAGSSLDRTFDLAMSVEVAEHLPDAAADRFVATLTGAAPVVLFSAAIPFQGGTGHVNEQWPGYWAGKFAAHDFVAVDALRARLWDRDDIAFYYRQNLTYFVRRDALSRYPELERVHEFTGGALPALVHPEIWNRRSLQPVNIPRIIGRERSERLRDTVNNWRRRLAG